MSITVIATTSRRVIEVFHGGHLHGGHLHGGHLHGGHLHGGHLHPTLNPNELKCNYCGWTRIEVNLRDYVACRGKLENIHKVN
jgi:hypothetical protein